MEDLTFQLIDSPPALVFAIRGDADSGQTDALERELTAVAARNPKHLVLDISGLSFIGSSGMGHLMKLRSVVVRAGGKIFFAAPRPEIAEAFRRAGLHRAFVILPTVEESLRA